VTPVRLAYLRLCDPVAAVFTGSNTIHHQKRKNVLNDDQQQKILKWMKEWFVKTDGACPMCDNKQWEVGNAILGASVDLQTRKVAPVGIGPSVAMVQVSCGNCGFIMLLDARRVGLIPGVPQ
jgi:hypothetical protein